MPHVTAADGVRIHHEVIGRRGGEPVLMVQGLGADSRGWVRQRRALGADHALVMVDNRGVGRSDAPEGPYDLSVMADDAIAVLDELGLDSVHVVGASMGGVIAQLLGVLHPERVRSLTLACTASRHHPWRRELLAEWARVAQEDGMGALAPEALRWLVGPRSLRRLRPLFELLGAVALDVDPGPFVSQIEAILALDDEIRTRLVEISVPTLVVVGSQDILTPVGDSEEIAALVPGAELAVVNGAAHGFMVEHASTFNHIVGDFLVRARAGLAARA